MKIPSLKRVGKGLLSSFLPASSSPFLLRHAGHLPEGDDRILGSTRTIVDPSLCYSAMSLIYDNDKFRPPDKCPARKHRFRRKGRVMLRMREISMSWRCSGRSVHPIVRLASVASCRRSIQVTPGLICPSSQPRLHAQTRRAGDRLPDRGRSAHRRAAVSFSRRERGK